MRNIQSYSDTIIALASTFSQEELLVLLNELKSLYKNVKKRKGLHKGIYWNTQKSKYHARKSVNGKLIHIGFYEDYDTALLAWYAYGNT